MRVRPSNDSAALVEPLNRREGEILALLAQHHSAAEIAQQLHLALSSVKWNLQQLYGKLGVHNRKDAITRARALGLLDLVAPAAPLPGPKHNLPLQLTRFFGREAETAQLKERLAEQRLVTLTGTGGVGKTRLALRVAEVVLDDYEHGVWFVELAQLADPQHVAPAMLTTLGLLEDPERPALAIISSFFKDRRALLILDNCEHVVAVCAQAAESLLQSCPSLSVLATSREVLGVGGERVFNVPTLSTPDVGQLPTFEALEQFEAVRLFVERAQAAFPGFALTPDNAPSIAQVCWMLDGIPLAIELAAARVKTLRVEQIAARLAAQDRFRLLTGGSRTALPRQQTLLAMIAWSYDLLSEREQVLFRRLAVFAGGWSLEAAETVCASLEAPPPGANNKAKVHPSDVLDRLTQVANKSLVIIDGRQAGETRFRMLETIRQYAYDRLREAGEGGGSSQRHLAYFVALAERAQSHLRGPDQVKWLDRVEEEHDNLRTALAYSVENDVLAGLRLASALEWYWWIREHKAEGGRWLNQLLGLEAQMRGSQPLLPARALTRGLALNVLARLTEVMQHGTIATDILAESVALHRSLGPPGRQGLAYALWLINVGTNETPALLEESLALFREVGDKFGIAECTFGMAAMAWWALGDFERGRRLAEENVVLRQEIGDSDGLATGLLGLAYLDFCQGDFPRAARRQAEALAHYRRLKNKWGIVMSLSEMATTAWALGDYDQARQTFLEAGIGVQDLGDRYSDLDVTFGLGNLALSQGDYQVAGRWYEKVLVDAREARDKRTILEALLLLGELSWSLGDYEKAQQEYTAVMVLEPEVADNLSFFRARGLNGLGQTALAKGEIDVARICQAEALALWRGTGSLSGLHDSLETVAMLATKSLTRPPRRSRSSLHDSLETVAMLVFAQQRTELAARLLGATQAQHASERFRQSPIRCSQRDRVVAEVRTQLGEAAFTTAFSDGRAMPIERAVDYALEVLSS